MSQPEKNIILLAEHKINRDIEQALGATSLDSQEIREELKGTTLAAKKLSTHLQETNVNLARSIESYREICQTVSTSSAQCAKLSPQLEKMAAEIHEGNQERTKDIAKLEACIKQRGNALSQAYSNIRNLQEVVAKQAKQITELKKNMQIKEQEW